MLTVGWYRFVTTIRQKWSGYVTVAVLIALVGGLAIGSIAAARRTEASFPAFLASTNPSDMDIDVGNYDPTVLQKISHLPQVRSLETYVSPNANPVRKNGMIVAFKTTSLEPNFEASVNGLYFNQDKVDIVSGRMANPHRADEVVVDELAANAIGYHVGQVLRYGFFSNAQLGSSSVPMTPAYKVVNLHVVGIGVFNDDVVEDDVDQIPKMLMTPALTRQLLGCCITYAWSGLQLRGGAGVVGAVEREYLRLLPSGDPYYFHVTSVVEAEAEQAIKPESVALAVFGCIAALTALVIAGLAVSRQFQLDAEDREVMRSLGAGPAITAADGLFGTMLAIVAGSLIAGAVAVALSPIRFGPVRVLEAGGVSFDWFAIGLGVLALIVILGGIAVIMSVLSAAHRLDARRDGSRSLARGSAVASLSAPLPVAAATGTRFALSSGRGRSAVPVRSAIVGVVLAVTVVVTALTFGDSLNTLISHPPLYGWNWNAMMESNAGYGDIPQVQLAQQLRLDKDVSAWSGVYFDSLLFDGQPVPVIGGTPGATVAPPLLAGHGVERPDQVVFGRSTLLALHKQVGDTVRVSGGGRRETLTIVGEASLPAVGIGFGLHLSIGTGAVVDYHLIPAGARDIQGSPTNGPNAVFVRFNEKASTTVATRSVQQVANTINKATDGQAGIQDYRVLLPAEIINYKTMGAMPAILAGGLAFGAVLALGLTLAASVRRRRQDLALLKALGFTRRQLAGTVGWQATVTSAFGALVGAPLGIFAGKGLWDLFAHELDVIPAATVPVLAVLLVAIGTIVLANLVALLPGHAAAHTPVTLVLRAE